MLPVPDAQGLRPTPDRVRETLFNWLGQDLSGMTCLDLFAGSGALGFEAASRGADAVTLVEFNPRVAKQLRDNQYRLDAAHMRVVQGDAFAIAAQMPGASFDVIFLDPPFAEDWLRPALEHAARLLRPGGAVYVETDRSLTGADAPLPASLEIVRQARAARCISTCCSAAAPKPARPDTGSRARCGAAKAQFDVFQLADLGLHYAAVITLATHQPRRQPAGKTVRKRTGSGQIKEEVWQSRSTPVRLIP